MSVWRKRKNDFLRYNSPLKKKETSLILTVRQPRQQGLKISIVKNLSD